MYGEWTNLTTNAFANFFQSFVNYLPRVLFAVIIVFLGVLVGKLVKIAVVKGLKLIRIKPYTDAVGLDKVFTKRVELAELLGDLASWTIIIVSLLPALEILNLPKVYDLVYGLVAYIPRVIVAVAIIVIGAIIADLVARLVESTARTIGAKTAAVAADLARWTIIIIAVISAVNQLGINTVIVNQVVTGLIALIALAGGLAFGLGGQDAAKEVIANAKKSIGR
jgi:hypothetical protein